MRLLKLTLGDFRGFESLELELSPDVTVLVGINGAGKTSILDAVALMMSLFVARVTGQDGGLPVNSDVRIGASTVRLRLAADFGDGPVEWAVSWTLPGHPPTAGPGNEFMALSAAAGKVQRSLRAGAASLPLVVYLTTDRHGIDVAPQRAPSASNPLAAYEGALQPGGRDFSGFWAWYRDEEDIYNELVARGESTEASRYPVVRAAILKLVPGATDIRIERRSQRMTLLVNDRRLDVAQLSGGEKGLLALAGDVARRMALAAPNAQSPLEHPAVVLIDEIELHLHPGLQRVILPRLRNVFPKTQFVVTTHSPQVLSSVVSNNVRVIDNFALHKLDRGTWKRDTNRILEAAFGDAGRPPEVAEKLNRLRTAVDEDRVTEARALIQALRDEIEGDDPDVFFYEQLLPPDEGSSTAA